MLYWYNKLIRTQNRVQCILFCMLNRFMLVCKLRLWNFNWRISYLLLWPILFISENLYLDMVQIFMNMRWHLISSKQELYSNTALFSIEKKTVEWSSVQAISYRSIYLASFKYSIQWHLQCVGKKIGAGSGYFTHVRTKTILTYLIIRTGFASYFTNPFKIVV